MRRCRRVESIFEGVDSGVGLSPSPLPPPPPSLLERRAKISSFYLPPFLPPLSLLPSPLLSPPAPSSPLPLTLSNPSYSDWKGTKSANRKSKIEKIENRYLITKWKYKIKTYVNINPPPPLQRWDVSAQGLPFGNIVQKKTIFSIKTTMKVISIALLL